jgi:hypothetical protein
MAMRLGIFQILEKAAEQKATADKIAVLREHQNGALYQILKYAYDPNIIWDLPEGIPPYKPCPHPAQDMRLISEMRRLYLFIKGGNPNLTKLRRESLFIEMIESVHPNDAIILVNAKDKKLPYKGINAKLVKEAFPGLIEELPVNEKVKP